MSPDNMDSLEEIGRRAINYLVQDGYPEDQATYEVNKIINGVRDAHNLNKTSKKDFLSTGPKFDLSL